MEEQSSDRDPVAEEREVDESPAKPGERADDEHLFGIDLGPAGDRGERSEPDDAPAPTRERRPIKTLTERLATAAADRDNAEPADEESDSSS